MRKKSEESYITGFGLKPRTPNHGLKYRGLRRAKALSCQLTTTEGKMLKEETTMQLLSAELFGALSGLFAFYGLALLIVLKLMAPELSKTRLAYAAQAKREMLVPGHFRVAQDHL